MHKKLLGMAVAMTALVSIFGAAQAQDTPRIAGLVRDARLGEISGIAASRRSTRSASA